MIIKKLDSINFLTLIDCFLKAFENYFIKMPTDPAYYEERWKAAKVRYDLSYGMFMDEKLVGFIINAIDEREGNLIAFNSGTGVIPEYRGQRIVNSIYQYAIPDLLKNKVSRCRLEVIKDNAIAIKAYTKIGFEIIKSYKCYSGTIQLKHSISDFELKKVDAQYFNWDQFNQALYSWDNQLQAIKQGSFHFYAVLLNGVLNAYFVINPKNGYVAQFDVVEDSEENWIRLFTAIHSIHKTIKINNVDEQLIRKITFLSEIGLENTVDQYEMELCL